MIQCLANNARTGVGVRHTIALPHCCGAGPSIGTAGAASCTQCHRPPHMRAHTHMRTRCGGCAGPAQRAGAPRQLTPERARAIMQLSRNPKHSRCPRAMSSAHMAHTIVDQRVTALLHCHGQQSVYRWHMPHRRTTAPGGRMTPRLASDALAPAPTIQRVAVS